jgi:hypothetical protein
MIIWMKLLLLLRPTLPPLPLYVRLQNSVIFFFSLFLSPFCNTTSTNHIYLHFPLLHIPYKLGCYYNCILIYEWFYNIYGTFIAPQNLPSLTTTRACPLTANKHHTHPATKLSLHSSLPSFTFFSTIMLTFGVHQKTIPVSMLSLPQIMPLMVFIFFTNLAF